MAKEKTQDPRLLCYISSIPYGFDFPYRGNEGKQHQDRGQGPFFLAKGPHSVRFQFAETGPPS